MSTLKMKICCFLHSLFLLPSSGQKVIAALKVHRQIKVVFSPPSNYNLLLSMSYMQHICMHLHEEKTTTVCVDNMMSYSYHYESGWMDHCLQGWDALISHPNQHLNCK